MQWRQPLRWSGVEPRFFARHLAKNPLPEPFAPKLLAAADFLLLTSALHPRLKALFPAAVTAYAIRRVAVSGCPVPWPTPGDGYSAAAPRPVASLLDSTVDSSSPLSIHCIAGTLSVSHFWGALHTPGLSVGLPHPTPSLNEG